MIVTRHNRARVKDTRDDLTLTFRILRLRRINSSTQTNGNNHQTDVEDVRYQN